MYEQPYWIAGLAATEVLDRLKERSLSCEGPTQRGETMSIWECKGSSRESDASYEVSIVGRDAERLRSVTARVGRVNRDCHQRRSQVTSWPSWPPFLTKERGRPRSSSG